MKLKVAKKLLFFFNFLSLPSPLSLSLSLSTYVCVYIYISIQFSVYQCIIMHYIHVYVYMHKYIYLYMHNAYKKYKKYIKNKIYIQKLFSTNQTKSNESNIIFNFRKTFTYISFFYQLKWISKIMIKIYLALLT